MNKYNITLIILVAFGNFSNCKGANCNNATNEITGSTTICGDLVVEGTIANEGGVFPNPDEIVLTVTGNSGGAVGPTTGNINIVGSGDIVATGNPGTSTVTLTTSGVVSESFDVDNGANVVPSANVLQVSGLTGAGFVPSGIETHNGGGTGNDLFIENRRWDTQYIVDNSTTVGERGTFTSIQAAIDAAVLAGDEAQILIRAGTYTEDLTLHHRVNLEGITVDGRVGTVNVIGNHTFSASVSPAAICAIENISFSSSTTDTFTINPSSDACLLVLKFCQVTNDAGVAYVLNPTGGATAILGQRCTQTQAVTQCATMAGSSNLNCSDCAFGNTTPGQSLFTLADTSTIQANTSSFNSAGDIIDIQSATASIEFQYNSSQSTDAYVRFTAPGTAMCRHEIINSDNSYADFFVMGAGTFIYADLVLIGSAKEIDPTTTDVPETWKPFATAGTTGTAVRGTSGFNDAEFMVNNGFVQLVTPPNFLAEYTDVTTTPYVVSSTDQYLSVDTSTLAITVQLPDAPATLRTFIIKDRTGNAGANNITVTTVGGAVNIDGLTSQTISTNFGFMLVMFNGTSYEIY